MRIKVTFPDKVRIQQRNEPRIPPRCRVGFQQYTVVSGDTMYSIAQRYNVTVDFLTAENPHIEDPGVIFPGDVLCVPGAVTPPGDGRVPETCPEGFERYTVVAGDTINGIAQRLAIDPLLLIANNPHITDPSVIFPGDVLCIPIPITFPCCTLLTRTSQVVPLEAAGAALTMRLADGRHSLSIMAANLPAPSIFGDFNAYEGFVGIPGIGGFGLTLQLTTEQPPVWAGGITLRPVLTTRNQVYVQPSNTSTGQTGQPVLQGNLEQCGP